jgi:hypothetical protein
VRAEAEEGLHRNILVPVSIENIKIPLLFRPIQSVRLIHWGGDSSHPQFLKLITDLTPILGLSPLKAKEAEKEKQRLAEEERKQKEAEPKRKAEEEQRRNVFKAEIKPEVPEPDTTTTTETKSPETRRTRKSLRFGILVGVAVLLTVGIWWRFFQPPAKEVQQELENLNKQALNLENAIAKLEKPLQIDEFAGQRDTLSRLVGALSEQAAKVGLESQLERLQDQLKHIQIQLVNKEKELIAARKGKIFVESVPDNANVEILDFDESFQQGMELETRKYHLQV